MQTFAVVRPLASTISFSVYRYDRSISEGGKTPARTKPCTNLNVGRNGCRVFVDSSQRNVCNSSVVQVHLFLHMIVVITKPIKARTVMNSFDLLYFSIMLGIQFYLMPSQYRKHIANATIHVHDRNEVLQLFVLIAFAFQSNASSLFQTNVAVDPR